MDIVMNLNQKSRGNVARFTVVPNKDADKENDLRASGAVNYGQLELVVPDTKEFDALKEGTEYNITIEPMAAEAEAEKETAEK